MTAITIGSATFERRSATTSGRTRRGAARTRPAPVRRDGGAGATLADELERRRLVHRAARIRSVLDALHRLAADGPPPAPLRHRLDDFSRELAQVERRLRQLRGATAG